jgi:hypothetical protein
VRKAAVMMSPILNASDVVLITLAQSYRAVLPPWCVWAGIILSIGLVALPLLSRRRASCFVVISAVFLIIIGVSWVRGNGSREGVHLICSDVRTDSMYRVRYSIFWSNGSLQVVRFATESVPAESGSAGYNDKYAFAWTRGPYSRRLKGRIGATVGAWPVGDHDQFQVTHFREPFKPTQRESDDSLIVPHWFALAVCSLATTWAVHRVLKKRRPKVGFCKCGYDLRGSIERCPECGRPIPAMARPLSDTGPAT